MTAPQIIGGLLVAAFFGGLYVATAQVMGWWNAVLMWLGCCAATAVFVVGVLLMAGELS